MFLQPNLHRRFQYTSIQWSSLSQSGHDALVSRESLDFSLSYGLKQLVEEGTRETAVLDLDFLSSPLLQSGFECEITDGISDHKAVLVSIIYFAPNKCVLYSTFPGFNVRTMFLLLIYQEILSKASNNSVRLAM